MELFVAGGTRPFLYGLYHSLLANPALHRHLKEVGERQVADIMQERVEPGELDELLLRGKASMRLQLARVYSPFWAQGEGFGHHPGDAAGAEHVFKARGVQEG